MMQSKKYFIFPGLLSFFSCLTVAVSLAAAEDCGRQLEELSRITGLLERQNFLEKAIVLCPDDYQMNYFYAYNLERLRKYEESLVYYRKSVQLNPDFAKSYVGMGDVYLVLKNNKEAVHALKKAISLDAENILAQRLYAKAIQPIKNEPAGMPDKVDKQPTEARRDSVPPVKTDIPEVATEKPSDLAAPAAAVPPPAETAEGQDMTAEGFARDLKSGEVGLPVRFLISSGELSDEAKEMLDRVVCKALQGAELRDSRFEIAGHTDDSGTVAHNMWLSQIRAEKVRDYLVEKCGAARQRFTVAYFGQSKPKVPNTTRENRRQNRRVEIRRLE